MFFTIKRIRVLGKMVGVSCVLVGLIVLFFVPATGWQVRHPSAFASFATLFVIGPVTIVFTRIRDVAAVVKRATFAGYTASEEEKRHLEDGIRELGRLYLLVLPAYTIVWLLIICLILEPASILTSETILLSYAMFTWTIPILFIIFFAIPYSTDRMYPEARILLEKSLEGAQLIRMKRQLGETNSSDLRIMKEDESKKEKED